MMITHNYDEINRVCQKYNIDPIEYFRISRDASLATAREELELGKSGAAIEGCLFGAKCSHRGLLYFLHGFLKA